LSSVKLKVCFLEMYSYANRIYSRVEGRFALSIVLDGSLSWRAVTEMKSEC